MMENDKPGGSTPQQYGLPLGATELQDLIEYREMNFALGNIFKACYRRGTCSHSDELRDMRKIVWFATREIERLEKQDGFPEKVDVENVKEPPARVVENHTDGAHPPRVMQGMSQYRSGQDYLNKMNRAARATPPTESEESPYPDHLG